MAQEQPDRLSQLPDDLLQHILQLAPCREAATTAVLSRRWRGLWPPPTTGAVKIYIPSRYIWPRDASLSLPIVEEALATARGTVERLAFHAGEPCWALDAIVGDVLSHPASRGVQDVRVGPIDDDGDDDDDCRLPNCNVGVFEFSLGVVVPSSALRVLHVTNCRHLPPPPAASTFPCLEVLRLRKCTVHLQSLRDMVAASPQLTTLQLEYIFIITAHNSYFPKVLCCQGVTTLVLLNCCCEYKHAVIELDTLRLQHFRYRGKIGEFTLASPPPDLRRAYLHILDCYRRGVVTCERFWSFLKNFSCTKVLKLKLDWLIDYVAALERRRIRDLLIDENQSAQSIRFSVENLEIDAPYNAESNNVGVAIGNLLQCCPALHHLSLKLNSSAGQLRTTTTQSKAQMMEFHKSIDHFRRRRQRPVVPLCGDNGLSDIPDIPGLSDRWFHFSCLQFHLKRLNLQFHMDKDDTNCVGVRLVKFFIQRGMALEEIYIDDGNMKLLEHMNCKINGYPANPHQPFSKVPCVGENVTSA